MLAADTHSEQEADALPSWEWRGLDDVSLVAPGSSYKTLDQRIGYRIPTIRAQLPQELRLAASFR